MTPPDFLRAASSTHTQIFYEVLDVSIDINTKAACNNAEQYLCLTCSTTSGEGWVCQNELYMEGLWTNAFSN